AIRPDGGSWTWRDVTSNQNFSPTQLSIDLKADGSPVIAFRDASTNRIQLAEQDSPTNWTISDVAGEISNLVGIPLRLLLDSKDRPWVMYNFAGVRDELRLVRRDSFLIWNQVSVTNNAGSIANEFDFHLTGEDFYVVGKKNRPGDNGLALLFAPAGVTTSIEELANQLSLQIAPNPVSSQGSVRFNNPKQGPFEIGLYNLNGQKLHSVMKTSQLAAGQHDISWDASQLASGVYFLRLQASHFSIHRKVVVLQP
ncbi:MAG: T9SS type A sorting domain-containing protein, partial [Bacteroidota bacterium]